MFAFLNEYTVHDPRTVFPHERGHYYSGTDDRLGTLCCPATSHVYALVHSWWEGNRGVVPVVPVGEQQMIKWGKTRELTSAWEEAERREGDRS